MPIPVATTLFYQGQFQLLDVVLFLESYSKMIFSRELWVLTVQRIMFFTFLLQRITLLLCHTKKYENEN